MKKAIAALGFGLGLVLIMAFENNVDNTAQPRIKRITNLKTHVTQDYFYDSLGRVIKVQNPKGQKTVYDYNGNTIVVKYETALADTYKLNNTGVAALLIRANAQAVISNKYQFDKSGYLTGVTTYMGPLVVGGTNWTIADENVRSTFMKDETGHKYGSVIYYNYYTDRANTISDANKGITFLGTPSKNLEKESIAVSVKGDTIARTKCKYRFTKDGKVAMKVMYDNKGVLIDSTAYSYY